MPYVEVSVNSPIAQRRTFSYSLPDDINPHTIEVGQAVWVPFGERTLQGIVLEITEYPAFEETRDIFGIIDPVPLLSPAQVALARWISQYYLSPLFEAVALMLPPGFERRVITHLSPAQDSSIASLSLNPEQRQVLETLAASSSMPQNQLEKTCGTRVTRRVIPYLVNLGLVVRSYKLEKEKVKPRMVSFLHLREATGDIQSLLVDLDKRAPRQAALLRVLIAESGPITIAEAKQKSGVSGAAVKSLVAKGIIKIQKTRVDRDPLATKNVNLSFPLSLTDEQETVWYAICKNLGHTASETSRPAVYMLYGVTGSGKTEVYIQALEEALKHGKRGIVLVPEIAMTPQILERFVSRFPGRVAVLHSELSIGEQFDEWWRIKNGDFDVVIGPRSAIFAPMPDLGIIIIDEEHEWTYKQTENTPRYHTREVAIQIASLTGAVVVLGSATPDIGSFYRAKTGEYKLLELPGRLTPDENTPLPQVEVVDLRQELKAGNQGLFSRLLYYSIEKALNNREQIILFLNRRGSASVVECRSCGWVILCRRCKIPLTFHFAEGLLICHQCNYRVQSPRVCPKCRSRQIKYLGAGTERLEQETRQTFPRARVLRWDSDTIRASGSTHQQIFDKLKNREADILIGTQIISKGLDLPGLTLVGVVSADIAINLPDFRAGERIFQLLSQVAGRAGRGVSGGKVIIQTYSPDHYAIKAAALHDYHMFYSREIAYRHELNNPPFTRLVSLVYSHHNENRCRLEAGRIHRLFVEKRDSEGVPGISFIGPAPAFIYRLRGRFRWQIILRGHDPSAFISTISLPRGWAVDIDPVGLT